MLRNSSVIFLVFLFLSTPNRLLTEAAPGKICDLTFDCYKLLVQSPACKTGHLAEDSYNYTLALRINDCHGEIFEENLMQWRLVYSNGHQETLNGCRGQLTCSIPRSKLEIGKNYKVEVTIWVGRIQDHVDLTFVLISKGGSSSSHGRVKARKGVGINGNFIGYVVKTDPKESNLSKLLSKKHLQRRRREPLPETKRSDYQHISKRNPPNDQISKMRWQNNPDLKKLSSLHKGYKSGDLEPRESQGQHFEGENENKHWNRIDQFVSNHNLGTSAKGRYPQNSENYDLEDGAQHANQGNDYADYDEGGDGNPDIGEINLQDSSDQVINENNIIEHQHQGLELGNHDNMDQTRDDQFFEGENTAHENMLHDSMSQNKNGKHNAHRNAKQNAHLNGKHIDHENGKHIDHENGKHIDQENGKHIDHENGKHIAHENGKQIAHETVAHGDFGHYHVVEHVNKHKDHEGIGQHHANGNNVYKKEQGKELGHHNVKGSNSHKVPSYKHAGEHIIFTHHAQDGIGHKEGDEIESKTSSEATEEGKMEDEALLNLMYGFTTKKPDLNRSQEFIYKDLPSDHAGENHIFTHEETDSHHEDEHRIPIEKEIKPNLRVPVLDVFGEHNEENIKNKNATLIHEDTNQDTHENPSTLPGNDSLHHDDHDAREHEISGHEGEHEIPGHEGEHEIPGHEGEHEISGHAGEHEIPGHEGEHEIPGREGEHEIPGHEGEHKIPGHEEEHEIPGHEGEHDIPGHGGEHEIPGHEGEHEIPGHEGEHLIHGHAGEHEIPGHEGEHEIPGHEGEHPIQGHSGEHEIPGHEGEHEIPGHAGEHEIPGHEGEHEIPGHAGEHEIPGHEGEHLIHGHAGEHEIPGHEGEHEIPGHGGEHEIPGHEGEHEIPGHEGEHLIHGHAGEHEIPGHEGEHEIPGHEGEHPIQGHSGEHEIPGHEGEHEIPGHAGEHEIPGHEGEHEIPGHAGEHEIPGHEGEHLIHGHAGEHEIPGHEGEHEIPGHGGEHEIPGHEGEHEIPGHEGEHEIPGHGGEHEIPGHEGEHEIPGHEGEHEIPGHEGEHEIPGHEGEHEIPGHEGEHEIPGHEGEHEIPGHEGEHPIQGHTGEHEIPGHEGEHEIPGHGGEHEIPGHEGEHEIPSHEGKHEIPGHGGEHEIPGHEGEHEIPGHAGEHEIPGHEGEHEIPGHGGEHEIPGHEGEHDIPGHEGEHLIQGHTEEHKIPGHAGEHEIPGHEGEFEIPGHEGEHEIPGHAGEHEIPGHEGEHEIPGHAGEHEISGHEGEHEIPGHAGEHEIPGHEGEHEIPGHEGEHEIPGHAGEHEIPGHEGEHEIPGHAGEHEISGHEGEHEIPGHAGEHEIPGHEGEHEIPGHEGEHEIPGHAGEHEIPGHEGEHEIPGHEGEHPIQSHEGEHEIPGHGGEHEIPGHAGEHEIPGHEGDHEIPSHAGEQKFPSHEGEQQIPSQEGEQANIDYGEVDVPDLGGIHEVPSYDRENRLFSNQREEGWIPINKVVRGPRPRFSGKTNYAYEYPVRDQLYPQDEYLTQGEADPGYEEHFVHAVPHYRNGFNNPSRVGMYPHRGRGRPYPAYKTPLQRNEYEYDYPSNEKMRSNKQGTYPNENGKIELYLQNPELLNNSNEYIEILRHDIIQLLSFLNLSASDMKDLEKLTRDKATFIAMNSKEAKSAAEQTGLALGELMKKFYGISYNASRAAIQKGLNMINDHLKKISAWGPWAKWTSCPKSCTGQTFRMRERKCMGSDQCIGRATMFAPCPSDCKAYSKWSEWNPWGACTRTCGVGVQIRTRMCKMVGSMCKGQNSEIRGCNNTACPTPTKHAKVALNLKPLEWGHWSSCSVTCGVGTRFRQQLCPQHVHQSSCEGNFETEKDRCTKPACRSEVEQQQVQILQGADVVLQCGKTSNHDSAVWVIPNGKKLDKHSFYKRFSVVEGKLLIRETQRQDHGIYHCITTDKFTADVELDVLWCGQDLCQHGGECIMVPGDLIPYVERSKCSCTAGYTGMFCEKVKPWPVKVVGLVLVSLIVVGILTCIVVTYLCQRKRHMKALSENVSKLPTKEELDRTQDSERAEELNNSIISNDNTVTEIDEAAYKDFKQANSFTMYKAGKNSSKTKVNGTKTKVHGTRSKTRSKTSVEELTIDIQERRIQPQVDFTSYPDTEYYSTGKHGYPFNTIPADVIYDPAEEHLYENYVPQSQSRSSNTSLSGKKMATKNLAVRGSDFAVSVGDEQVNEKRNRSVPTIESQKAAQLSESYNQHQQEVPAKKKKSSLMHFLEKFSPRHLIVHNSPKPSKPTVIQDGHLQLQDTMPGYAPWQGEYVRSDEPQGIQEIYPQPQDTVPQYVPYQRDRPSSRSQELPMIQNEYPQQQDTVHQNVPWQSNSYPLSQGYVNEQQHNPGYDFQESAEFSSYAQSEWEKTGKKDVANVSRRLNFEGEIEEVHDFSKSHEYNTQMMSRPQEPKQRVDDYRPSPPALHDFSKSHDYNAQMMSRPQEPKQRVDEYRPSPPASDQKKKNKEVIMVHRSTIRRSKNSKGSPQQGQVTTPQKNQRLTPQLTGSPQLGHDEVTTPQRGQRAVIVSGQSPKPESQCNPGYLDSSPQRSVEMQDSTRNAKGESSGSQVDISYNPEYRETRSLRVMQHNPEYTEARSLRVMEHNPDYTEARSLRVMEHNPEYTEARSLRVMEHKSEFTEARSLEAMHQVRATYFTSTPKKDEIDLDSDDSYGDGDDEIEDGGYPYKKGYAMTNIPGGKLQGEDIENAFQCIISPMSQREMADINIDNQTEPQAGEEEDSYVNNQQGPLLSPISEEGTGLTPKDSTKKSTTDLKVPRLILQDDSETSTTSSARSEGLNSTIVYEESQNITNETSNYETASHTSHSSYQDSDHGKYTEEE